MLLEKTDHLSDTIYRYQKGKHVMATPVSLTLRSDCEFDAGKREAILDKWNQQTAIAKANVRYKAEVKSVTGTKGDFTITLTNGDVVKAANHHHGHRHPGQPQPGALRRRQAAARPVPA